MIAAVSVHINPNLPWYIARSSGIVAWALITASVIWGLAFSGKLTRHPKLPSPAWMLDLHRFLGGMAVVFMGFHIGGLMMDKYVGYGPSQVIVPFTGAYRPVAVAWGIVAMYLLLTVEVTSLLMSRLPRKVWHGIHLSSFGVFTLVTVHGLSSGTDARHGILPLTMVLAALVVAMLTGMRAQIAVAKRTERALRAQRATRPAAGRPAPERVVRRPAADDDEVERPVRARPSRVAASADDDEVERPVRARPSRVAASADDDEVERPVRARPSRVAASADDEEMERPVRARPSRVAPSTGEELEVPIGRHVRPAGAPAAGGRPLPAERPMAPAAEAPRRGAPEPEEPFRPAFDPAAYAPTPAPYSDPRLPAGPYADPRVPAGPYADPRVPAGPYADPRVPAAPYADPRYADPRYADPRYADPRYAPAAYQDPRYAGAPYPDPRYADPRYAGGPYADPRYADPRYADPRYAGAPYADPRYPGAPYGDPRPPAGPDPRFSDPGFDPRVGPPSAPGAVPIPPMPAVTAGPPTQRPAAAPPASSGLEADDEVHEAELVEEMPRGAAVYPLRPVQHTARTGRPRVGPPPAAGPSGRPAPPAPPSEQPGASARRPAPSVTGATPAGVHRVPADGRGPDTRPPAADKALPADGRGQPGRRQSADGRPTEDVDIPSERVAGRLP